MNKFTEKFKFFFARLYKKKFIFAMFSICVLVTLCLVAGIVYVAFNPVVKITYNEASSVPTANVSSEDSSQNESLSGTTEIEIPDVEIADENSNEDIKNIEDEIREEGSEETKDITIIDSFNNVTTKQWNSLSYGIDVSSHNGHIEWDKVAQAGVEFVMIRCGYRGYVSGKIVEDARFDANIRGASQHGISIGIYFYSTAVNEREALQEAAWIAKRLGDYEKDGIKIVFPVAYDFEEFYNKNSSRAENLSKEQLTANTKAFLSHIGSVGYTPMLYASKSAVDYYWDFDKIAEYDFWLAHYVERTNYGGAYSMWQYSNTGKVSGIKGNTDLNISYYRYLSPSEAVVCNEENLEVYNGYNEQSGIGGYLAMGAIYERRRTLLTGWSEIYYNGFTGYVKSDAVSLVEFEPVIEERVLSKDTPVYSLPIKHKDKQLSVLPSGKTVKITGVYQNKWYQINENDKTRYILY